MPAVVEGRGALQQRIAAVKRAKNAKETLHKAVEGTDISGTMLAAIGIRESGFDAAKEERLADGSIGNGRGAF
jgi:hypothetical protein